MKVSPTRNRQAERREATRREIVETAWEIARSDGLAAVTLREIADRIGMRPPSLYTHFESKNAVYDAMFTDAYIQLHETSAAAAIPDEPRAALLTGAQTYFDFATADLARYQLMNQPALPDFRPSESAYAASLRQYEWFRGRMAAVGVTTQADLDLWTALTSGFVNQQLANDPGGDRWRRQLPRLVDMFCTAVGIPDPEARSTSR
ncbi:TetR/AcrR family transcriptional regulator [Aldersonia sp. NBC_00410]|uniref:TetR/AcrR family transcriptional regulator n=1 Tax=Aldersonia sp. NBC_00410 TaxID=2975954 RepID=UPI00224E8BB6|nr:TetR/AcrR family transcriptional regulator [Aldersonia sp. NBC_00410]MCX5043196.1 TetR/AcrR family transcriptional regulator [Aldersonia sp. NBC_00410]